MLKINIKTGNSAFRDQDGENHEYYAAIECARLLRRIADNLVQGDTYGSIMDINGNKVGEWSLEV